MAGSRQDHYQVLGVTCDAPDEVIRAAYRALVAKYHPDRNPGDADADHKLKRLNAAWAVLGDPAKRSQYDELTRSPEAAGGAPEARPEPPRAEPPRWKVPEEPPPPAQPRWESPPQAQRAPTPRAGGAETVAVHAARGFGRVVGWCAGFLLVGSVIAAMRSDGCGEQGRTTTPASTATAPRATTTAALTADPPPPPPPETWDTWRIDSGRFTLSFPTEPKSNDESESDPETLSALRDLHWQRFVAYRPTDGPDAAGYVAVFMDRPPASADEALSALRGVVTGGNKVAPIYDRRLSAGGLPAEDLAFRLTGGAVRQARLMLASTRSCLLYVDSPPGYDESAPAKRFFASFRASATGAAVSGRATGPATAAAPPTAPTQTCTVQDCMNQQSDCELACNPRCALGAGVSQPCMQRCMQPCREQEQACERVCR